LIYRTRLTQLNAAAPVPEMGAFETVIRDAEGGTELMPHQEVLVQQRLKKKRRSGTVDLSKRSHQFTDRSAQAQFTGEGGLAG
jgi:hypothetical protein